eukprot:TRINITY_DN9269_c0_g1_i1.p1 TRINITY_DN9269_c0_g1~~TRINITY_DN9269_c0_g1_i1.p1  ORF type:complete len:501 (-),score=113.48 TRINITY_DN9269_c0_g1_i1:178-1680(-)
MTSYEDQRDLRDLGWGDPMNRIIFTVVLVIVIPLNITLFGLFVNKRGHPALRIRGFWSLVWSFASLFMIICWILISGLVNFPCKFSFIPVEFGLVVATVELAEFNARLYCFYSLTEEVQQHVTKEYQLDKGDGAPRIADAVKSKISLFEKHLRSMMVKHRHQILSDKPLSVVRLVGIIGAILFIYMQYLAADHQFRESMELPLWCAWCQVGIFRTGFIVAAYLGLMFGIALFFTIRVRNVKEVLHLRRDLIIESTTLGIVAVLILAVIVTCKFLMDNVRAFIVLVWIGIFVTASQIFIFILLGFVIFRMYGKKNNSNRSTSRKLKRDQSFSKSKSKDVSSLRAVLSDPEWRMEFQKYLCSEFSVENLMVWEVVRAVLDHKLPYAISEPDQNSAAKRILHDFTKIYEDFIDDDSQFCINISHSQRLRLKRLTQEKDIADPPSFFAELTSELEHFILEVEKLLRDAFYRFKKTPQMMLLETNLGTNLSAQTAPIPLTTALTL